MRQATNKYLTMTMPSSWNLEVVAGKEGQMQMSLHYATSGTNTFITLFAHWNGLDPRKWMGTNSMTQYKIGSCDYFVSNVDGRKEMSMIAEGRTFIVNAIVPLDADPETLSLLLNCLGTMKPK